jgi:basic membrane protein A
MIAGKLTETNILGAVGGKAVPEVNRLLNAFCSGAREVNPEVEIRISFTGKWFDAPRARETALSQISRGADLVYAERSGVIEACREKGILAFGNLQDQNYLAPDTVITGPVWDMWPTLKQLIIAVRDDDYQVMDLAPWSMMVKGGAYLAPYHSFDKKIPAEVKEMVERRRREIMAGTFRVPVNEATPPSD